MISWLGWQDLGVARVRLGILYFEKPHGIKDFPIMHHAVEMKSPTGSPLYETLVNWGRTNIRIERRVY